MSYEFEGGTVLLAQQCLICGRPLRDPTSVELGIGPICREDYGFDLPAQVDDAALEAALSRAPEPLARAFVEREKRDGTKGAVSQALHVTGAMWEETRPGYENYLQSFVEIARASGYKTMANAVAFRLRRELPAETVVRDAKRGDRVRLKDGTEGEVFWVGSYYGKPSYGLKTSPAAEPTWFKGPDIVEILEKEEPTELVEVSDIKESDIRPPCKVRLRNGTLRAVGKTGRSSRGFWIGLVKLDGGRGYDFTNLDDVMEVIYEDATAAPPTPVEASAQTDPTVRARDQLRMRDGSIREVVKTGTSARGAWIGVAKLDKGRGLDFIDARDIVEVLPPKELGAGMPKARPVAPRSLQLDARLFPHQQEGAEWLASRSGGILADDMGLGKTATSIFALSTPAVIICPASLKTNWSREVKFWRPELSVAIVEGKSVPSADVIVCNFERAKGEILKSLINRENNTIVVDEAHALKNLRVSLDRKKMEAKLTGSQRAQNVWDLCNFGGLDGGRVDHVFLLTGTPMPNGRHEELFPLLNIADGGHTSEFMNFYEFCSNYCPPQDIPGTSAKSYSENARARELHEKIQPLLLRRTKDLLELPAKFRQQKFVDMEEGCAREYRGAEKDFRNWIRQYAGAKALDAALKAEALVRLTKLRELAAVGKVPGMVEEIREYLAGSKHPLVVMAHHKKVLDCLEHDLKKEGARVGRIDGQTKNRQAVVDAFQAGDLDVVLCSISAAGVGLTLTAADTLYFAERVWRPFDLRQAEDRIHRIGQKKTATIVYYDAPDTIDEVLSAVIDKKIANAEKVIDGVGLDEEDDDESVVSAVLRDF